MSAHPAFVRFRNPVVMVSTSGYEPAAYVSGSGTASFIFLYTVQPGDQSSDLEYWDEDAFKTDGFVRRAADEVSFNGPAVLLRSARCFFQVRSM